MIRPQTPVCEEFVIATCRSESSHNDDDDDVDDSLGGQ